MFTSQLNSTNEIWVGHFLFLGTSIFVVLTHLDENSWKTSIYEHEKFEVYNFKYGLVTSKQWAYGVQWVDSNG